MSFILGKLSTIGAPQASTESMSNEAVTEAAAELESLLSLATYETEYDEEAIEEFVEAVNLLNEAVEDEEDESNTIGTPVAELGFNSSEQTNSGPLGNYTRTTPDQW